jgi:hypothetical protein
VTRVTNPAAFRLGKLPPRFDDRTLRFASYLTPELAPPPASIDYATAVKSWPMMGNDTTGDCTCAAAGHMIEEWTANIGEEKTVPDATILAVYDHFTGGNPDAGVAMLDVLNYWRATGIGGDRIRAYAQLEPQNASEARDAIFLFGNCYLGLALPDFAVAPGTNFLATPWSVPPQGPVGTAAPNPANGHCVPLVAYDSRQAWAVTWGALKPMTWQFFEAYMDEAFAVLSPDWISSTLGESPSGFDLAALTRDLAAIPHA